ncbi:MAG TPA: DUF1338 domain-containing protein [Ramlibacter sp.]|nr:DUF1338 domain-containing protein [Ramlibacter sp.]
MNDSFSSNLQRMLASLHGASWAQRLLATVHVDAALLRAPSENVSRAEIAQALNLMLFDDLLHRVPVARAYAEDVRFAGGKLCFDHGAVRTVDWACGALPTGEAALTRVLRCLGFRLRHVYPLDRLGMTGRSWAHDDCPEGIAQFFVSELHPERFSPTFQKTVTRVLASSRDPLQPRHVALLERVARDGALPQEAAVRLLAAVFPCFGRQHEVFALADYQLLARESAEMAWIATEGNAFNHATDRVADIEAVARSQRALGRPIKDEVEVSQSGRVRQTAFRATRVRREFLQDGGVVACEVPGSFYEFIARDEYLDEGGRRRLDLQFDPSNATNIFAMTAAA